MNQKKICVIATIPVVLKWFMAPHIVKLTSEYEVTLIANGSEDDINELLNKHIKYIPFKIKRKISVLSDLITLIKLCFLFRKEKFDRIHSIMPKSGLLAMLAAKLVNIPVRFHTFTGQVWVNKTGMLRSILKLMDKTIVLCSTKVLTDSQSQKLFLIDNQIVSSSKIEVLASGSVAGVDLERFKFSLSKRQTIRLTLAIPDDSLVLLFVGRLNKDKGVHDLISAFNLVSNNIHLILVGPDEENLSETIVKLDDSISQRIHCIGYTKNPEDYMSASDIFCLPSYREGFGSSIIEAAAVGVPCIASEIYGIVDAVEANITGILHEPGDIKAISSAILKLLNDSDLRNKMGSAAKKRVENYFSQEILSNAFIEFYHQF